uniref:Uncharacterized protein n=1 Tax=Cucumis melo TaxID=3656 RepID=A0A9I9CLZ9_CUCME
MRSEKDNEHHIPNHKDTSLRENHKDTSLRENHKDTSLCENSSNKRKTLTCCLDAPEEKIQRVETEKKDDGKMEAQLDVPIADFWSDPCLEFAIKTLTGALPVENATTTNEPVSSTTVDPVSNTTVDFLQGQSSVKNEIPLSFPFGDSWADPCLDFAFKTLTGAIPIDDSLEIQSFFEERLESSRSQKDSSPALPDFGSPNLFQNDISSHFDGPEKSATGQHLSLDPQLTLGNVSLPSCSGFTSQQQSSVDRNRSFRGR